MNLEQQLKLQAWVDGELRPSEARELEELAALESEAQGLVSELRLAKSMLAGNELERQVGETREFYWSKVLREIDRAEPAREKQSLFTWLMGWRRLLVPVSSVALIAFVSLVSLRLFHPAVGQDGLQHLVEAENLSEHMTSLSFKSQSENMFVVYLYSKDTEAEKDPETEPADETVIQ